MRKDLVTDLGAFEAAADFQGARLTLAREARGLTQKDLAERIGATPSAISQFESGSSRPAPETVARLALALGFPAAFFARPLGDRLQLDECHFRRLRSASKKDQRQLLARGDLLVAIYEELRDYVDFPEEQLSQHRAAVGSDEEIEMMAERLRDVWGLGMGPVDNMVRLLENKGVLVLELPGHSSALDAFSVWSDERAMVFLSSQKASASRKRFDCAHELGHLLMHDEAAPGDRDVETQADRFASAFLLPAESFSREYPKRLSWGHLRALKRRWKVSLAAMVRRAFDLGLISEATYRRAFVRLGQSGWRTDEPDEPEMEGSSLIRKAVQALVDVGDRRLSDLLDALAISETTVRELLRSSGTQPTLFLA